MNETLPTPPEEELVPLDDAVIGRAFRRSLWVLALAGGVVAAVLLFRPREEAPPPTKEAAWRPPTVREEAQEAPDTPFRDVTREAGIAFVHEAGRSGEKLLPETMGAGAAFFDADGDGDADLLLVNGAHWPQEGVPDAEQPTRALYLNDGAGRFTDATRAAGLAEPFYGTGVAVGDVDGDGDRDLFLTGVGGCRLYLGDGHAHFTDATAAAGFDPQAPDWTTSAGFFDADGDGDLDLFTCCYIRWSAEIDRAVGYTLSGVGRAYGPPTNFEGAQCRLWRNDGRGRFEDVSKAAGVQVVNPTTGVAVGKALALAFFDADDDGDLDVFVANDTTRNFLFLADGKGGFVEAGEASGVAYDTFGHTTGAMGADVVDLHDDGCSALAVGNFASESSSLYLGKPGQARFRDVAVVEGLAGPSRRALSFGLFFFDYDLDGYADLFQTNGHLEEAIASVQPSQSYRQPSQLFRHVRGTQGCFRLVPAAKVGDLAQPVVGRGAAYADVDGDGDLDVLVTQRGDRPVLLRNDQATGHHWLRVRLVGPAGNGDALGARLDLTAGGRTQRRLVTTTRSYLSQCEPVATFGLGDGTAVERLHVRWPDGTEQDVPVRGVDRLLEVRR